MPQKVDQGIPYISPLDFTETGIDYSHAKKISNEDYIELSKKCRPEKNDIIFPRYGTIGKIRIIDTDNPVLVSYSCCTIRNYCNCVSYKYMAYALQSSLIRGEIDRYINKTTQPNVGLQSIKSFLFPLPPLEEQHRIVAKIEELLPYCDQLIK
jgi:type I restriction enzyme S subunit